MMPSWSHSRSAWSLGWLSPLLGWIKVTYLHWGCLSLFSASAWTIPYTINEKFSEGMVTSSAVLQLWEDRLQWDNRMPFGQFGQSHRSLWFILCLRGQHNEPSYQWDPVWALSVRGTRNCTLRECGSILSPCFHYPIFFISSILITL